MPLTDIAIRNLKPRARDYKVTDGAGLHLLVRANGSRLWRMSYRHGGAQKGLAFGAYPAVGLADARAERDAARKALGRGEDPAVLKKIGRITAAESVAATFALLAEDWLKRTEIDGLKPRTLEKNRWLLDQALPAIGARPISAITPPEMFAVLKRIEKSGRLDTARAVRRACSAVFRHAIVTARAVNDPCIPLVGATAAPKVRHMAALFEPAQIAGLLKSIRGYDGHHATRTALRLLPMVFVRSSELRKAAWREFDLDRGLWAIPAARMKRPNDHLVPLSRQAVALLREHWEGRVTDGLVFPSLRSSQRAMSENTVNAALRRMGYSKDEMTGHGFRRIASTIMNEHGWNPEWIERQLAHVDSNKVRAAYNAAEFLADRTRLMQWWSDWLETTELLG